MTQNPSESLPFDGELYSEAWWQRVAPNLTPEGRALVHKTLIEAADRLGEAAARLAEAEGRARRIEEAQAEVRRLAVAQRESGLTHGEIAKNLSVHRGTVTRWLNEYRRDAGAIGLKWNVIFFFWSFTKHSIKSSCFFSKA